MPVVAADLPAVEQPVQVDVRPAVSLTRDAAVPSVGTPTVGVCVPEEWWATARWSPDGAYYYYYYY